MKITVKQLRRLIKECINESANNRAVDIFQRVAELHQMDFVPSFSQNDVDNLAYGSEITEKEWLPTIGQPAVMISSAEPYAWMTEDGRVSYIDYDVSEDPITVSLDWFEQAELL